MGLSNVAAPSTQLPPIRQIHEQPIDVLVNLVGYLHVIYNPPVRGARRIDRKELKDEPDLGAYGEGEGGLEALRADEYERAFALRWLTALVSRSSELSTLSGDDDTPSSSEDKVDALIRSATSLIAICAGTTAARTLTRRYAFYAPSLQADVDTSLTDVPISVDSDCPSVGTQTWGSACLMAEMLVEEPEKFGLCGSGRAVDSEVRILELGAGTGLVSLAVTKLLCMRGASARIVASDYHPAVLSNLEHNVRANFPPGTLPPGLSLSTHSLDWSMYAPSDRMDTKDRDTAPPFDKPFDVILAADVVYEPAHTSWIHDTVSALLPHPTPTQSFPPRFHLLMPLRPTHTSETRMVEETFLPFKSDSAHPGSNLTLYVLEKETVVCEAEDARGTEVEYVHYAIGWA